jgi:hypothetical protein
MSWLSSFLHNPIDYVSQNPLKALGLLAAPVAAVAAPFLAPEIAAGAGLFGGAEAAGAGAAGAEGALGLAGAETGGLAGAELGAGGGTSLAALTETGGPFAGIDGGTGFASAGQGALGYAPNFDATFGAVTPSDGLYGSPGFGGEAAPLGAASPADAAAAGSASGVSSLPDVAGAGGAQPSFWDKLVGGAESSLMKNPLGIGLAGAGLGYNILRGSQTSPEMKALAGQAGQLNAQQAQLMSYLQKGTLPPGLQQGVQNATAAMKANLIRNAAHNGQSTDPTQNTALAQDLANVDRQAIELIAKEGVALMNSGLQAAQISSNLFAMLEKIHQEQSASTGRAIANFAAALSGGPKINVIGNSGLGFAG